MKLNKVTANEIKTLCECYGKEYKFYKAAGSMRISLIGKDTIYNLDLSDAEVINLIEEALKHSRAFEYVYNARGEE